MISIQRFAYAKNWFQEVAREKFGWLYAETQSKDQNETWIFILGFNLPFVPTQRTEVGSGPAQSFNLVRYRGGQASYYRLVDLAESPGKIEMSDDTIRWSHGGSSVELLHDSGSAQVQLAIHLSLPNRTTWSLTTKSSLCQIGQIGGDIPQMHDSRHAWTPILVGAEGLLSHTLDGASKQENVSLYVDRNLAVTSLQELTIDQWFWLRSRAGDGTEYISYWLKPKNESWWSRYRIKSPSGGTIDFGVEKRERIDIQWSRSLLGGLKYPRRFDRTRVVKLLDEGPFYLRFECDDDGRPGVGEWFVPDRLRERWHLPFVRMRVDHEGAKQQNSIWLPLFSGPRKGRLKRLLDMRKL